MLNFQRLEVFAIHGMRLSHIPTIGICRIYLKIGERAQGFPIDENVERHRIGAHEKHLEGA
jgi:hypothetical protein